MRAIILLLALFVQVNSSKVLNICFVVDKSEYFMALSGTYSVDLCPTLCLLSESIEIDQSQESKSFTLNDPFLVVLVKSHSVDVSHFGIEFLSPLPEQMLLLMKFHASHNELSKITDNFFEHMQNLIEIDFSYNKLVNLSKNTFDGSYKLRNVNVSYNRLLSLDVDTFWDLSALKTLDLSHNWITIIEKDLFANSPQLIEVHLNNNHIKSIHVAALLKAATNLCYFDLNENSLTHLDCVTREQFPKLLKFGIARNYISHENLKNCSKAWQHLEFIGIEWIQKIADSKLTNKSTSTMMTVFVVVFCISTVITIFMKFNIFAKMQKRLGSNTKGAIMLLRNHSNVSTESNDSTRNYGIYRKLDDQC